MKLYRIVQDKSRAEDLSGTGAFRYGGRWNSKGTYMLYCSENSSLAYLESLVHFDKLLKPPKLYIIEIDIANDDSVYILPDTDYPDNWIKLSLLENKQLGDKWMSERKWLGIKLRSAINSFEYNYLLNPLFPRYYNLVNISLVKEIEVDNRLVI